MTVFCGPSGSGKSSLAMDTIYAEGQRRYVESLSAYARQFVGQMQKPQVEHIDGLSPAIAIEQKNTGPHAALDGRHRHRDLRLPADPVGPAGPAALPGVRHSRSARRRPTRSSTSMLAEPRGHEALPDGARSRSQVGEKYETLWDEIRGDGLRPRAGRRRDATRSTSRPTIDRRRKHEVEVVVDRVIVSQATPARGSPTASRTALALGRGVMHVADRAATTCPKPKWHGRVAQPAPRLRPVRPQLRAAHAAQFLVQQSARLVPGVRRAGRRRPARIRRRCCAIRS